MWKAHFWPRKMRPKMFQYKHLTLTYGVFQVNHNTIPEFSQILYQLFWTFHSTVVVNFIIQASLERS